MPVLLGIHSGQMAEDMQAFAAAIDAPKPRWLYCLGRVRRTREGHTNYSDAAIRISGRILGAGVYASAYKFRQLDALGYDEALATARPILSRLPYDVGPLEAWHIGHVYFARVRSHPHVVKIGFSRRVRDRLEDVSSKSKTTLVIRPGHLKVGTMADERWWHDDWRKYQIEGEWFFDPRTTDRSLPDFLATQAQAA